MRSGYFISNYMDGENSHPKFNLGSINVDENYLTTSNNKPSACGTSLCKEGKILLTSLPTNLLTSKRAAFTLAEVLITLAIIGIVAALTIPTLINNAQDRQFKAI